MSEFQIEDIWGIGQKLAPKLRTLGIGSAKDLRDSDPSFIRKNFSVIVERIVYELRGISCLPLTDVRDDKKSITYSRTFGTPVTAIEELEEALSDYVSNACIKLRKQNSRALSISIFLSTNYYNVKVPRYRNSIVYTLPVPSSDTKEIIHYSKRCFHQIYKPGYQYNKLGIILLDLQSDKVVQQHLFIKPNYTKSDKLMGALDLINNLMGKNTIFIAAQGTERAWTTQSQKCSPAFTTNINELPIVK